MIDTEEDCVYSLVLPDDSPPQGRVGHWPPWYVTDSLLVCFTLSKCGICQNSALCQKPYTNFPLNNLPFIKNQILEILDHILANHNHVIVSPLNVLRYLN